MSLAHASYKHPNNRGHIWKRNGYNGAIDVFAHEEGNHNGPVCVNCGYGFCHHCKSGPDHDCPSAKKSKKRKKAKRA